MICKDKNGRELDVTFDVLDNGEIVEATEAYYLDNHDEEVSDEVYQYLEIKYFSEAVEDYINRMVDQFELNEDIRRGA